MSISKILIVDDEVHIRSLLDTYLKNQNFQTLLAQNGDEALEIIHREKVDLVFLDIKLPGKSGIELLKLIKDYNFDIQVVMISGNATVETAKETLFMGAFDYIKKPVDLEKVTEVICCLELLNYS
jgi:DNA-binding NtrC family response regulator